MAKGIYVGKGATFTTFTSKITPTSNWYTGTNKLITAATNDYGTWKVQASELHTNSDALSYAFDGNIITRCTVYPSLDTTPVYITLYCPTNTSINPTRFDITHSHIGNSSMTGEIQGLNADNAWVKLGELLKSESEITTTVELSDNNYYSAFRLVCYRYSAAYVSSICEFEITAGTLKNGEDNVAHKVTKAYIGVDNKARKIKKGYIGVGGVARLFYEAQ